MTFLLALLVAFAPQHQHRFPHEDDPSVDVRLTLAALVFPDGELAYGGRGGRWARAEAGVNLPDGCFFGAFWTKATREWTALGLHC